MLKYSSFPARVVAGLGVCMWMAAAAAAGQGVTNGTRVTSVKLNVAVDQSSPCRVSLSASIGTSGKGTVWYRIEGPAGVTYYKDSEGTTTLEDDTWFGLGRSATMSQDIKGEFRVVAAMVGPGGKHGPAMSATAPANYTCGGGSAVASPVAAGAESQGTQIATEKPGFQVTAVKVVEYSEKFYGACPTNDMVFRWEVSASGSGKAVVRFTQQGRPIREAQVSFAGPGSKVVTYRASDMGAPGGHYQGWIGLQVLSPNQMAGGHEAYTIQCAPRDK